MLWQQTLIAHPGLMPLLAVLIVWTIIWKGLALWKAARLKDQVWFWFLLVLNTAGILEIIYLCLKRKKKV